MHPLRFTISLGLAALTATAVAADTTEALVEIEASPLSPYAALRQQVHVTVGESVSLVTATFEYYYVRAYDPEDGLNPFIVDLPVFVRTEDNEPGRILQMVNARLQIGRHIFRPRSVLLLDHTAYEPVPDLPEGAKIVLVSFSIPRGGLKPRFKARLAYDQPHLFVDGGKEQWTGYLPLLPDLEQLRAAHRFAPDDFTVTFTALPGVELERDSINAEVVSEDPDEFVVRARHRETVSALARKLAETDTE